MAEWDDATAKRCQAYLTSEHDQFFKLLDHYLDQFKYNAGQRLTTFQFFLSAYGLLASAFVAVLTFTFGPTRTVPSFAAPLIAVLGYVLTLAFGRLDRRNDRIVAINHVPLIYLQSALEAKLGGGIWNTFAGARHSSQWMTSYRDLIPTIYMAAALTWIGAYFVQSGSAAAALAPGWQAAFALVFAAIAYVALFRDLPLARRAEPEPPAPMPAAPAPRP